MPDIIVIDYGMGNTGSIANMVKKVGGEARISSDLSEIKSAAKIILPGVGTFDNGVRKLRESKIWDAIVYKVLQDKTPILGICLGMQLFTEKSEEGESLGFGFVRAKTVRFRFESEESQHLKIPHMGWNEIKIEKDSPLFYGFNEVPAFYFVHSYYVECQDQEDLIASCNYNISFVASFQKKNIYATQFHPEKSHRYGVQLIRNFVEKC